MRTSLAGAAPVYAGALRSSHRASTRHAIATTDAWAIAHLAFQAIAVTGFVVLQAVGFARLTTARS